MSYLEELLPEFRKGAKIRQPNWMPGEYIYLGKNGIVYDEKNKPFDFTNEDFFVDWDIYTPAFKSINWNYIIKNKCLCRFEDDDEFYITGLLVKKGITEMPYKDYIYKEASGSWWKKCRPVRRDEVTFYEDREDER